MRRLVNHEAARVGLVAVPAPEIVGTVRGVQHPVKVDGKDVPDDAGHQQILDLRPRGGISVVERDEALLARPALGVDDGLALDLIRRHWLFGDDVTAQFHGTDDVLVVVAVARRHDDHVRLALGDHLVELVVRVADHVLPLRLGPLQTLRHSSGVAVADAHQLAGVRVRLGDSGRVHPRPAARPHLYEPSLCHGDSPFLHSCRLFRVKRTRSTARCRRSATIVRATIRRAKGDNAPRYRADGSHTGSDTCRACRTAGFPWSGERP